MTGPLVWHFSSSVCVLPDGLRDLVIYSRKAIHGLSDEEPYRRSGVKDLFTHNQCLMLRKCFAMNTEKGGLPVSNLTDQEQTCGQKSTCILEFEMIEKLLKLYHESGLVKDINKSQLALAEKTLNWK